MSDLQTLVLKLQEQQEQCFIEERENTFTAIGINLHYTASLLMKKYNRLDELMNNELALQCSKEQLKSLTDFFTNTEIDFSKSGNNTKLPFNITLIRRGENDNPHYQEVLSSMQPRIVLSIERLYPERGFELATSEGIKNLTKSHFLKYLKTTAEHLLALEQLKFDQNAIAQEAMSTYDNNEHLNWARYLQSSRYIAKRCFPYCYVEVFNRQQENIPVDNYDEKQYSTLSKTLLRTAEIESEQASTELRQLIKSHEKIKPALQNKALLQGDANSILAEKMFEKIRQAIIYQ